VCCIRIRVLGSPSKHPIGAVCGSAARTDLAGGRWATIVPTGTVILIEDDAASDDLRKELVSWVRREKGPTFTIDKVQFALGLPK
ncbi:hypothetical protein, partial [Rhizobium ruizarguesonis]|uniref:hypothetical protein n=1 Tax=Rhizobium ruizarguesonis TaxID=2081791 RepID=UPI00103028AD